MRPKYIKAVETGDIIDVRLFLANEMMLDPRGKSFDEMLKFAESHREDLYVNHDGLELNEDQSVWNDDLLNKVKNDLDYNFSKVRLNYYYRMAKVVLAEKAASLGPDEEETFVPPTSEAPDNTNQRKSDNTNQRKSDNTNQRKSDNTDFYKGVAYGGSALGVVGLLLGKTSLVSIGFAGAVIGGVLLFNNQRK